MRNLQPTSQYCGQHCTKPWLKEHGKGTSNVQNVRPHYSTFKGSGQRTPRILIWPVPSAQGWSQARVNSRKPAPSPTWLPTYTVSQTTKYASNYAWWTLIEMLNDKRNLILSNAANRFWKWNFAKPQKYMELGVRVTADLINVRPPGFSTLTLKPLEILNIKLQ